MRVFDYAKLKECSQVIMTMIDNQKWQPQILAAIFSAQQHICFSALYAIARPSVHPPVSPSHG